MPAAAQPRSATSIEAAALAGAAIGAGFGLLVALVVLAGRSTRLAGDDSVAIVAAVVCALVGAPVLVLAYIRNVDGGRRWRLRHPVRRVLDTVGVTLTGVGISVLLVFSTYQVLQLAFVGLQLNAITAAALVAATAGTSTYALSLLASQLTSANLATLLALFLVAGVFTSMLTARDPDWWQRNFSYLGMGWDQSAYAFNLTVAVAGLAILTLSDYLTTDLTTRPGPHGRTRRSVRVVRITLAIVGIGLIGLSVVSVDLNNVIHVIFSIAALLGFAALLILVPLLITELPRAFVATTFAFIGIIVLGAVLFALGSFNLTALELIAVVVIFAWLILFTRSTAGAPPAFVAEVTPVERPRGRGALVAVAVAAAFVAGWFVRPKR